jgi:hypothetical protein
VFVCGVGEEGKGTFGALGGVGKGLWDWREMGERERGGIGFLKR